MRLESSAFAQNQQIPQKYTCDGLDVNPPLAFTEVPPAAKSLALIFEDPDAPAGNWVHWTVWNIDPKVIKIDEDDAPYDATEGITSFGRPGYGGPCPPDREHRYFFRLYALDVLLNLPASTTRDELENAMHNHIVDEAELMGRYERK